MTDSAVLNTVLGLVFLFYALALLCSGLVEMIANWVKKRAKYLLRGIRELIDDVVPADVAEADRNRMQRMPTTAQTALLNGMIERQRYDTMLHAKGFAAHRRRGAVCGRGRKSPGSDRDPTWLVGAQFRGRDLGLAAENSRPADLSRSGCTRRTLLVSGAGPGRNTA